MREKSHSGHCNQVEKMQQVGPHAFDKDVSRTVTSLTEALLVCRALAEREGGAQVAFCDEAMEAQLILLNSRKFCLQI